MTAQYELDEMPAKNADIVNNLKKDRLLSPLRVGEMNRRAHINFNKYLDLLSRGYTPLQARKKVGITDKQRGNIEVKFHRIVKRYQARKTEEIVFLAELRHNHIYKTALEEFEKSKVDAKGNRRAGNPIFLQIANDSIKEVRKLLGLDKSNGDIINNGNMAVFNWDSLHNKQSNIPQSLPNSPSAVSSLQELQKVDPVEERIRQLERLAAEKKLENERLIEEHGEPVNDHSDSQPVEEVQRRIVLKATKTVQPVKTDKVKVSASVSSLDELIG